MFYILKQKEVLSTNQSAFELLDANCAGYGSVIFSEKQTQGRGQQQTRWESNPGENLTISLILRFDFLNPKHVFLINILTAISISELLEQKLQLPAQIKWSNDILINGKKIAGVLIENRMNGNTIQTSVIGIGLNINQIKFSSFQRRATSMRIISKTEYNIEKVLQDLLLVFEKHYKNLKDNPKQTEKIWKEYEKRLYILGKTSIFFIKNQPVKGKILGVSEDGFLIFSNNLGQKQYCFPKDIVFSE